MLNPLDPKTDYGRACSIPGKWGLIDVAGSAALVLANPPMSACARVRATNILDILVLQAWDSDDLDSLLDRASAQASSDSFTDTGAILRFDGTGAVMLFAGDKPGDAVYGESRLSINAGDYTLFTAHYKGTGVEEVDIYRLKPRAQPGGPANGSQPFRSETNQTSSATSSRR